MLLFGVCFVLYISLFHEHSDRTNDMDTITLNVLLAEAENGLYEAL